MDESADEELIPLDRFVDSDLLWELQWKLGSRILVVGRNRYRLPQPSLASERQRSDVWALLPERRLGHLVSLVQVRRRLPEMDHAAVTLSSAAVSIFCCWW